MSITKEETEGEFKHIYKGDIKIFQLLPKPLGVPYNTFCDWFLITFSILPFISHQSLIPKFTHIIGLLHALKYVRCFIISTPLKILLSSLFLDFSTRPLLHLANMSLVFEVSCLPLTPSMLLKPPELPLCQHFSRSVTHLLLPITLFIH